MPALKLNGYPLHPVVWKWCLSLFTLTINGIFAMSLSLPYLACARATTLFVSALLTFSVFPLSAATKIDEGFSSSYRMEDGFGYPGDRINKATMGQEVVYWIQWKDHPLGHTTWRCVIAIGEERTVISDLQASRDDSRAEGYSICPLDTAGGDLPDGKYYFTGYLQDEKVGDMMIEVKTPFMDRVKNLSWMIWVGLIALIAATMVLLDRSRKAK